MIKLGGRFCSFFMSYLRKHFKKLPGDIFLEFYTEHEQLSNVINGQKEQWMDSRLLTETGETFGKWIARGNIESASLSILLGIIIEELEKRFSDLLYLETVEENIIEIERKGRTELKDYLNNKIIMFFVGDLLNREWLLRQYIRHIVEGKNLPPFDFLIQISAQKYEGRIVQTSIYFVDNIDKVQSKNMIILSGEGLPDMEVVPKNLRTIRKMMEMSGKDGGLIVHRREGGKYYIAATIYEEINVKGMVEVRFTEHLSWKIIENEQILFACSDGKYCIPLLDGDGENDDWIDELNELSERKRGLSIEGIKTICNIIEQLRKQVHGTSIVFMEDSILQEEVKRLSNYKRGYKVEEFPIIGNEKRVLGMSSIDGAILANINGVCHMAGAIFDGQAVVEGDSGRGARYNSLKNYVEWICQFYKRYDKVKFSKSWCLAVVLSEDKSVNLIFQTVEGCL